MTEVSIFPSQLKAIKSDSKVTLLLACRGFGKSYTVAWYCIYRLLTDADIGLLCCPVYNQLRDTVAYILKQLEKIGIECCVNTRPHWCKSYLSDHKNVLSINDGSGTHKHLFLASADNPDFLRGKSVHFAAVDEAALISEEIIDILTPALRGHPSGANYNYRILLATTPRDTSNWIYSRYIEPDSVIGFEQIKGLASENIFEFTDEKLEIIKSQMTDLMWRREMLAEWVSLSSDSMAYAFTDHHIQKKPDKEIGRLFLSCDINNKDLQSVSGWFSKDWLHIDGEISIAEGGNPQKVATEFHKQYSKFKTKQVVVAGDRYGSNQTTTAQKTYYQQLFSSLKELGWTIKDKTLKKNPSVWDSNEAFMKLCEKNQFTIDNDCKGIIKHLRDVKWKKDGWQMDKKLLDSGFYDSIRYIVWSEFGNTKKIIAADMF